jgi:CubicO group peptidase (beta-lactamase class C family)
MNSKVLAAAEKAAAELSNIRAFLVMWDGSVVSEIYYGIAATATLHHVRSITKSIVSALVGTAVDQGIIRSVEDKVVTYIPELRSLDHDDRKNLITIRHLLTMTSGFRWEESGEWFSSDSLSAISHAWKRPLAGSPGEVFNYDSASSDLLTVVLTRATQQDASTYLVNHLFAPLGITDFEWEQDPAGYYRASAGLVMRAYDVAKIGQLYLQNGRWNERQILSPEWVDQSFAQQVRVNQRVDYGYLWRSRLVGSIRHYYGMGYGGQYLLVVPDLNLVVVAIQDWQVSEEIADRQKYAFTELVFDPLVKAWQTDF